MVTKHGIDLAVHLITTHFGALVAKVCECLLRKGTLTLGSIIRFTELSHQQVKNSLLVLIQHNCVQAFSIEQEGAFGEAPKIITQYMVLFGNILHRIRFAKFLAIVNREFGGECQELFKGLLEHGRLTLQQLIERAASKQNEVGDDLRRNFIKLVHARHVERCPASEPYLAPPNEEENAAKKRAAKSAKIAEVPETIEQRALAAATPMDAKRFAIITNLDTDVDGEKKSEKSSSPTPGEKRKYEDMELEKELGASVCEEEVLWRANFEEFVRRLRHKACAINVRSRLDEGAAIVLSAMLEATRRAETKVKTEYAAPLSLGSIFEEVMKTAEGRTMNLDRVRASLVQLGCSPCREADGSYILDLKNIIELAQNDEVESIVLKRYGKEAYRIFRLLTKSNRLLESDKISDATFIEKKDTAKLLYKLWKDDYLVMEKTERHGPKQLSFLLWKVNKPTLWVHVLDEMYHAALNLIQRLAYEFEQEREIFLVPSEKRVGALGQRFSRMRNVKIVLESSLMKLDDSLMLFHDF